MCAVVFSWFAFWLLVSIVRVIMTSPGNIPEDREWDMQTATESEAEESKGLMSDASQHTEYRFTNPVIERLSEYPREVAHEDYKYLTTSEGPLIKRPDSLAPSPKPRTPKTPMVSMEKKKQGGVRICQWCFKAKPDRCHHCSQCNRCILKMDHHCPWVANCIGFYNYKFFFCMIFNTAVTCHLVTWSSLPILK